MIKKRVLLIEEDRKMRESISDTLNVAGYSILIAKNGEDGIIFAMKESPILIICNSNLSGLSGVDVLKSLRELKKTQLIPFIFYGENKEPIEVRKIMNLGADDYLAKPFKNSDLIKTVNSRVDRYLKSVRSIDNFLEKLINTSNLPSFIVNEDKSIEYSNNQFAKYLELKINKTKVLSISKIIDAQSFKKIEKIINEPDLENLDEFTINLKIKTRNGIEKIDARCIFFEHTINKYLWCMFYKKNNSVNSENKKRNELIISSLTKRETEVIRLIAQGYSNNEIAKQLFISNRTVAGHRNNLLHKTGSKNSVSLAVFAIRNSLI